ncbi:tRNA-(ms[2]io[6]A)-hydroxylase [Alkanindiges sp. WGS2144]|uniref:tRNA-(ms[2]io[6]A)-hydroxylase n=1 Tax=Alkanindiges sp. WGS2144 TaxID=3366808 RepID=UPI0037519727
MSSVEALLQPVHAFLGCATPQAWLDKASQPENITLIIQDHANCEKKAASTAVNLMFRYGFYTDLQLKLSQLVREEMLHYEQVLEIMQKRGQAWEAVPAGRYAAGLRKEIKTYEPQALIDVLIVGAFVEARSCERFAALAPFVDDDLARFYRYLLKSEARHFEDYLALAQSVSEQDISTRVETFRQLEAGLILSPDTELRFHSGVPA